MRWIEIFEHVALDEVEVVSQIGRNPRLDHFLTGAAMNEDGLRERTIDQDTLYAIGEAPDCYAIVRMADATPWLMELWTHEDQRGKGLALRLLRDLIRKHGRLFVSWQLSRDSIGMIEKIIRKKIVAASVVDISTRKLTTYNPDDPTHQSLPMYDEDVPGISRPILANNLKHDRVWALEAHLPRSGMLQPFTKILKNLER